MLSPEYLDAAPDALVELLRQLEDDILRDAARRIGKTEQVTDTAQWQLWRLEQLEGLREDVVRRLSQYSGKTDDELRRIFQESGTAALSEDDAVYQAAGKSPPPANASPALVNLLNAGYRQTRGTWQNLTATTANTVAGQFEAALNRAWFQVSSGAFDYRTAIKQAVDGLSRDMTYVTYPSGHRDTLEVAARRAVLTGVNQTAGKLQLQRMEDMDCSFVETTAHPGARPEHALWQGRVFHRGGAVTVDGVEYPDFVSTTGYGTGPGLCGWNCRHSFFPFFPGLSERAYSEEKLREYSARDMEYNGKMYTRYELSQIQRGLERRVRKWKRQYLAEDAAGADTAEASVRLRTAREQLRQFARQTGLNLDSSRIGVSGFGRSQAGRAAARAKKQGHLTSVNTELPQVQQRSILGSSNQDGGNPNINFVCRLDKELYRVVTEDIRTDEVIITGERIQHIRQRHPNDFERYARYLAEIVTAPDYILEANKPNTAFLLKEFTEEGKRFELILRLAVTDDPEGYKNSIITFLQVQEKRYQRYLRTKKILYSRE